MGLPVPAVLRSLETGAPFDNLAPTDHSALDIAGDAAVVDILKRTRAIIGGPR